MEREIARLIGRSDHEIATYKYEIDEQKRDTHFVRDELQKKHLELESVREDLKAAKVQLKKHQTNLADVEIVHQKYVQEASKKVADLTGELQAKASQVKQYAKENDTLKQEIQKLKQQV